MSASVTNTKGVAQGTTCGAGPGIGTSSRTHTSPNHRTGAAEVGAACKTCGAAGDLEEEELEELLVHLAVELVLVQREARLVDEDAARGDHGRVVGDDEDD